MQAGKHPAYGLSRAGERTEVIILCYRDVNASMAFPYHPYKGIVLSRLGMCKSSAQFTNKSVSNFKASDDFQSPYSGRGTKWLLVTSEVI